MTVATEFDWAVNSARSLIAENTVVRSFALFSTRGIAVKRKSPVSRIVLRSTTRSTDVVDIREESGD